MCEFCHKHGEGKKWYLQAKNYSEELLHDIKRRKFIEHFFAKPEEMAESELRLRKLDKAPAPVRNFIRKRITRNQKEVHFGQVVPIEDVKQIFNITTSIVRLECICRKTIVGPNKRFCYGVSMLPDGGGMTEIIKKIDPSYLRGPDNRELEVLSREETLKLFKDYEKEGMCHTVWTFNAPFIGGVCNCNLKECYAMKTTVLHNAPVMFKAEYIAKTDMELCTGCKLCMKVCQFNAIEYDTTNKKVLINEENCYGCGICRSVCSKGSINLVLRK
jgi:Pyruvate/2-oxoacid:ferredoxin oxidoreductase delta subunit